MSGKYTMSKDEDLILVGQEYVFSPRNPTNKVISKETVQAILSAHGISDSLRNMDMYTQAFTHSSYCKRLFDKPVRIEDVPELPIRTISNERLEFLGDGILECVTKYYLYRRFPREQEGFMTEKKIALVKNEAIGKLSMEMGLHEWYVMSSYSEDKNLRTNLKKLGCLFEAFIGAIFLDYQEMGFQYATQFIESVFEQHIDWTELLLCDDNYKNILQVKIQKEFKVTPEYIEISHGHEYHMGVYLCIGQQIWKTNLQHALPFSEFGSFEKIKEYLKIHKRILVHLGEGKHKIKKKSEQQACEHALQLF
jgi:dsRNA-specific ribonuclease